jgi:superfamily I DNA/RNA helicase
MTYHQLGDRVSRARDELPDFSQPGAFASLEAVLDTHTPDEDERFDELIVDEGQDFREGWAANLLRWLHPSGHAWWLEDPMQNLYGRPSVSLPGWVTLRSDVNYRTPKLILAALNRMLALPRAMEAGSPIVGSDIEIVSYSDARDLITKTTSAVTRCIGLGFKRPHIALVTYRGREHSKLTPLNKLGPYPLRASTGRYDLFGNALYTEGDILIDSVLRFKGRASPCVVFTEVDFETLDDAAVRRLFVGATRATMKLTLVASQRAAKLLEERLKPLSAAE